jgi:signal transduction histidine kinase
VAGSEIRRNRVSLETRLSKNLPPIMGDKIQLQQVILNLLVNAIEAMSGMPQGARQLLLTSDRVAETSPVRGSGTAPLPAHHALVSVHDSGPGLDQASLDHVFDTFYTTKPQGLGMGLAISRTIIEAHGGRLRGTANEPNGAIFQFTLPIRDSEIS